MPNVPHKMPKAGIQYTLNAAHSIRMTHTQPLNAETFMYTSQHSMYNEYVYNEQMFLHHLIHEQ